MRELSLIFVESIPASLFMSACLYLVNKGYFPHVFKWWYVAVVTVIVMFPVFLLAPEIYQLVFSVVFIAGIFGAVQTYRKQNTI
ncbi:hypothetical protein [Pedobacter heparinus]|uniref:hypothetical protein n=1 Tax=Pedobacter heparinus TaxID=984 RepID=UPI00292D5C0F|nr:hypothetical protein [Pedobacter heparinus]